MRVLPVGFSSLNKQFSGNVALMPDDFEKTYTTEEQNLAQSLAKSAMDAGVGVLTIGLINKASISQRHKSSAKSSFMAKIASDAEDKVAFEPKISDVVKDYNSFVRNALKYWREGASSEYYDDKGRSAKILYCDENKLPHRLEITRQENDVLETAFVNFNHQNGTVEYDFSNYRIADSAFGTMIYANLGTDKIVSLAVAKDWLNLPVYYSFRDNKPYMASYPTNDGKALMFFDENSCVQKIYYQEYDKMLGAMERGKPDIFIKDAKGDFLPLNWV